jgi:hypothetical protein
MAEVWIYFPDHPVLDQANAYRGGIKYTVEPFYGPLQISTGI